MGNAEVAATLKWLGERGIRVASPTPLLAIRIGVRAANQRPHLGVNLLGVPVAVAFWWGGMALANAFGAPTDPVFGSGSVVWCIVVASAAAMGYRIRAQEREIAARLPEHVTRPAMGARLRQVSAWNWAAIVITLGGGGALDAALIVTTPGSRPYGWSWLVVLILSAVLSSAALVFVLRTPVIAEDETSLAVDRRLWLDYFMVTSPLFAVYPMVVELLVGGSLPHVFVEWQIAYVVLALGTEAIGLVLRYRRLRIPRSGTYGVPLEREIGSSPSA